MKANVTASSPVIASLLLRLTSAYTVRVVPSEYTVGAEEMEGTPLSTKVNGCSTELRVLPAGSSIAGRDMEREPLAAVLEKVWVKVAGNALKSCV